MTVNNSETMLCIFFYIFRIDIFLYPIKLLFYNILLSILNFYKIILIIELVLKLSILFSLFSSTGSYFSLYLYFCVYASVLV